MYFNIVFNEFRFHGLFISLSTFNWRHSPLGKRTQDLAGKFEDFEFRAALTVAYYSSAFAKKKLI
jgi:hypothetical protein